MPFLDFQSISGNAHLYNRENALPTASTHAVGDTWTDTEGTKTQKTATLSIVGAQSPLDRYVLQTRSDVQSQEAIVHSDLDKAIARKIEQLIIQGEPESVTTEFEGLDSLLRADTRMMAMDDGAVDGPGSAETELTMDRLDAAIDAVEAPSNQVILVMNKTMRRKLTSLSRASGSGVLTTVLDGFGNQVAMYGGHRIVINDFITNSETYNDASTWASSTATTIFALVMGKSNQGLSILHNGSVLTPDFQRLGIKNDKNENLYREVVYIQTALWSAKKAIALGGIDSAA